MWASFRKELWKVQSPASMLTSPGVTRLFWACDKEFASFLHACFKLQRFCTLSVFFLLQTHSSRLTSCSTPGSRLTQHVPVCGSSCHKPRSYDSRVVSASGSKEPTGPLTLIVSSPLNAFIFYDIIQPNLLNKLALCLKLQKELL